MTGAFVYNWWYAVFAVLGIVLAAVYVLLMYQRTMTGPPRHETSGFKDLSAREILAIAPVFALIIALGFYPKPLLDAFNPAVDSYLSQPGPAIHTTNLGTSKENSQ
jgi:NADH-quinone oxidoreductase subunit M